VTPPKPHRVFLDRVSGYADEASAYLRRRRLTRQPFARIHAPGGRIEACGPDTEEGRELFLAASRVLDVARPEPG
jgi:hypothetical protein